MNIELSFANLNCQLAIDGSPPLVYPITLSIIIIAQYMDESLLQFQSEMSWFIS